mmetsp:Transcript_39592/g.64189  ORF Transcript_39592/g.64189 Transcript_39592/m.64189 type:complete len:124 (+) Transcript_39592:406-777(+)
MRGPLGPSRVAPSKSALRSLSVISYSYTLVAQQHPILRISHSENELWFRSPRLTSLQAGGKGSSQPCYVPSPFLCVHSLVSCSGFFFSFITIFFLPSCPFHSTPLPSRPLSLPTWPHRPPKLF